jgi:photosystem II stability/assembly factor-like uncharacterized protein
MSDFSENETFNEETTSGLIYTFAAIPGLIPAKMGVAFAAHNSGLYRSMDGGKTWQNINELLGLNEHLPFTSLAISPSYELDGTIFAGVPGGVFRSKDGGVSWKAILFPDPPPSASSLAISPNYATDETIFAGTMEDGVLISQDGGNHWVTWNFGFLDLNVVSLTISPNFAADETIFAGTETGIFRSTNGGRAWREVALPFGYDPVLCITCSANYTQNHTLYAGTENNGLWVSTDEGETWSRLAGEIVDDPVNSLLSEGSELLAMTSVALWHSADNGTTWKNCLPAEYADREITAILAPQGIHLSTTVLLGFIDGSVEIVTLR